MIFSTIFSARTRPFRAGCRSQAFPRLIIIFNQSRRQWLGQFRSITVQRIGLHTQRPRQLIGLLAVLDCRVIWHVDRLGNRTRDKRLRCGHHIDVAVNAQITLAFFAAGIGAIKHAIMLFFQMRRTFQRHRAANMVVGRVDVLLGKPK